jgi:hypothetical protein
VFNKININETPAPAKAGRWYVAGARHAAQHLGIQTKETGRVFQVHHAHE